MRFRLGLGFAVSATYVPLAEQAHLQKSGPQVLAMTMNLNVDIQSSALQPLHHNTHVLWLRHELEHPDDA